jgi:hypothetical protein
MIQQDAFVCLGGSFLVIFGQGSERAIAQAGVRIHGCVFYAGVTQSNCMTKFMSSGIRDVKPILARIVVPV